MNDRVQWLYEILETTFDPQLMIKEINMRPHSVDLLGQLAGGYIRMSGLLRHIYGGPSNWDGFSGKPTWIRGDGPREYPLYTGRVLAVAGEPSEDGIYDQITLVNEQTDLGLL
jgi:hypothetical protein